MRRDLALADPGSRRGPQLFLDHSWPSFFSYNKTEKKRFDVTTNFQRRKKICISCDTLKEHDQGGTRTGASRGSLYSSQEETKGGA